MEFQRSSLLSTYYVLDTALNIKGSAMNYTKFYPYGPYIVVRTRDIKQVNTWIVSRIISVIYPESIRVKSHEVRIGAYNEMVREGLSERMTFKKTKQWFEGKLKQRQQQRPSSWDGGGVAMLEEQGAWSGQGLDEAGGISYI